MATFEPPTIELSTDDVLFGRFGYRVGVSLVLRDGHYVQTPYPWLGEIADLQEGVEWFQGGRVYDVDSAVAAALTADGFTVT